MQAPLTAVSMSFMALKLIRPVLFRSTSRCTKLWRLTNAHFSSALARPTKPPVDLGQKGSAKGSSKLLPNTQATRLPAQAELPSAPNARTARNIQKQNLARYLHDSGETLLYKAPSHAGFLTATFLSGSLCLIGAVATSSTELWKAQEGLPWWVNTANRLGIICFAFLGGWIVLRATRHITSIKLMLKDDRVKMLVTVRRMIPLPFVPSKKLVTDPVDFILPSRMVAQLAIPTWLDSQGTEISGSLPSRIVKRISLALWTFFAGMRKVFTHEGFLDVTINGTNGFWKLDTAGDFANGGRNLLNIVSYET
jgi:hypothetical protein